jgi:hypothetical protein
MDILEMKGRQERVGREKREGKCRDKTPSDYGTGHGREGRGAGGN